MEFSEAKDRIKLVKTAIRKSVNELGAARALVLLPESDSNDPRPEPLAQLGFDQVEIWSSEQVQSEVLRLVLLVGETICVEDSRERGRFRSTQAGRSILCLALGGGGVLYCDHPDPAAFQSKVEQAEQMARDFAARLRQLQKDGLQDAPARQPARPESEQPTLTLKEQHLFTLQLATLLAAGVPLVEGLNALSRTPDRRLALVADKLSFSVSTGNYLSAAMSSLPRAFDKLYVGMLAIAEETGRMVPVLQASAAKLERTLKQRARLMEALTYPLFVTVFSLGIAFLLATWMVPQLLGVLEGLELETPLLTRLLLGVFQSGFLQQTLLVTTVVGLAFYSQRHSPRVREAVNRLKYRLPSLGPINASMTMGRWCRDLALMLDAGFGIVAALRKLEEVGTGFEPLDETTTRLQVRIAGGVDFGEAIGRELLLPPLVRSSLELGEASGRLPGFLRVAADHLEDDAERAIEKFLALLEPLTIGLLGLMVAVVILGSALPIFQVLSGSL